MSMIDRTSIQEKTERNDGESDDRNHSRCDGTRHPWLGALLIVALDI
jgi:hypothetical protein